MRLLGPGKLRAIGYSRTSKALFKELVLFERSHFQNHVIRDCAIQELPVLVKVKSSQKVRFLSSKLPIFATSVSFEHI